MAVLSRYHEPMSDPQTELAASAWLIAVLIFFGGVAYIALDTVRILFIQRGYRVAAPVLGFLEVIVFLLAVSQVLAGPLSWVRIVAYAAGFGVGTWVGIWIEHRLAMGHVLARVVTQADAEPLVNELRKRRYGITTVAAQGLEGDVRILFSVLADVRRHNPGAFVTFEDVRAVSAGWLPPAGRSLTMRWRPRPGP